MNTRRSAGHQGRVTTPSEDSDRRRPRRAVVWTAWLIVAGLGLAVVGPVIAILLG